MNNQGYIECAKDIREAGLHLLGLINDILELSKLDVGKSELLEDIVDFGEVINSCERAVKVRLEEARLILQPVSREPLPGFWADERKLKQMILNLLSNAIKFTPANGEIRIAAFIEDSGDLIFQVQDNGIGIAAKDVPRALEPFGQVDSGLNRKYPGTGLGLPLTKSLAELHGGSMSLESALGEGTTVTLQLPAWRFAVASQRTV